MKRIKGRDINMKKSIKIFIPVLLLTILFIASFLPIIQAEEVATTQEKPAADEMLVYFIRENNYYGSLRRIWVTCNENAIASIGSGNYCYFKVKTGPNIINTVQTKTPVGFYLLKYRPGETVYLLFGYMNGLIYPIEPYIGEELIKECKNVPLLEKPGPNDGYQFILMNPGFFGFEVMKKMVETINPDSDNAIVTFFRSDGSVTANLFGIWDEDGYLGSLRGHIFFQIKVKPGKHYFIAKSEKLSVVEADVEAGKSYYIQLKTGTNSYYSSIQLLPIKKDIDDKTLQNWLDHSTCATYDQSRLTDDLKAVMDRTKMVTDDIIKKIEKGEIETGKLLIEDAR
jgi:hypothetical protein